VRGSEAGQIVRGRHGHPGCAEEGGAGERIAVVRRERPHRHHGQALPASSTTIAKVIESRGLNVISGKA